MYKTVRISKEAFDAVENVRVALDCTFLEAVDAITAAAPADLQSIAKENLNKIRANRAKAKAMRAVETAQKRVDELNGT